MSQNSQQSNKDRSSNFSKEENIKLMTILKDYQIITSKKTDHTSNQQKEAAWRLLADKFNSDATKFRSIKQLQQKYNNMKKTARKEMAAEKYGRRQTGGGPPPPKPSETTEWLNTVMGESISGLPAVYDSDAMRDNSEPVPIDKVELETTANIHLDLSKEKNVEDFSSDVDSVFPESEQPMKETVPNYIELPSSSGFDTSTPKAMLRKPVSKELSFIHKKKKTTFTPLETRKQIIIHSEKKIDLLNQKQGRELNLAQYAKEEHELNMKHKKELHDLELSFKKKMYELVLEKCKYESEKAKLELNNVLCNK